MTKNNIIKLSWSNLWVNPPIRQSLVLSVMLSSAPHSHLLIMCAVFIYTCRWWWLELRVVFFSWDFPLQQWGAPFIVNTVSPCIVSSDSFRRTTVVTAQTPSLYSLSVSQISLIGAGCWQEAVSSCDVWSGICASEEVNYTTFKTLLCFTIHTVANHIQDTR